MEALALLGHNRGRGVGVEGHNAFEVFLTGGPYGSGKWVLLDHDLSTVIYNRDGAALLSLAEIQKDWKRLSDRSYLPEKQHGWLVCGLHLSDGASYAAYRTAEYLAGYSGPPPLVHLRRGETLRRYLQPGLEDGKTFVFWGRNYNTGGIPGLERSITWVNQPEKMHRSRDGAGFHPGQARYGNAVYTYRPDFANGDYREGVIAENEKYVVFGFRTPYIIAATPPNAKPWAIYEPGCRNGLVLHGKADGIVSVSTDDGTTWTDCGRLTDGLDLTDHVKGRQHYWLRFGAGARHLASSHLAVTTVCQANAAVLPRLKDGGTAIHFLASGNAVVSAGPELPSAQAHVVEGKFGTPSVTLELATPHGEPAVALYAAAHVFSSNPPQPQIKYQIELSADDGKTWKAVVQDWQITRRGDEPPDFWSQSLCWGSKEIAGLKAAKLRARFRNDGGKSYARGEMHLVYPPESQDATRVTFAWNDDQGAHRASHVFPTGRMESSWNLPTGNNVQTRWVDLEPITNR